MMVQPTKGYIDVDRVILVNVCRDCPNYVKRESKMIKGAYIKGCSKVDYVNMTAFTMPEKCPLLPYDKAISILKLKKVINESIS